MKCEKNLSSIEINFRIRIRIETNYGSETLILISTFIYSYFSVKRKINLSCLSQKSYRYDFDCKSLFPRTYYRGQDPLLYNLL